MSSASSASSRDSSPEATPSLPVKRKRTKRESDSDSDSESSDDSDSSETKAPGTSDEPVLSHAERRRREKRKAKEQKAEEDGVSVKKRKLKDGSAAITDISGQGKRQNSVWVGNMTFKTTAEDIRRFFDGVGEITRIHMPTKTPAGPGLKPENRGFAYVDFSTVEGKHAAIAKSEHPLLGRKLLIKDGDDFKRKGGSESGAANAAAETATTTTHKTHSKTAQKILRAQKQPPAPTLFIGNLPFDATEESIRQLLEDHREDPKKKGKGKKGEEGEGEGEPKKQEQWIRKVRMGTFEDSGLCKGFAFVDFTSIENATSALINIRNHNLHGRRLVFEYASADAVRRGAPKEKRVDGHGSGAGGGYRNQQRPFATDGRRNRSDSRPRPDSSRHYAKSDGPATESQEQGSDAIGAGQRLDSEFAKDRGGRDERPRHKGPKSRPKPGAALALAKRESAAIIPSQGQKIVF